MGVLICSRIGRNLISLNWWCTSNSMSSGRDKCLVLHLGQNNPMQQYKLEEEWLESYSAEKDLEVLVNSRQNMSECCGQVIKNYSCILTCIRNSVARLTREVAVPLYSALVKPCLKCCFESTVTRKVLSCLSVCRDKHLEPLAGWLHQSSKTRAAVFPPEF